MSKQNTATRARKQHPRAAKPIHVRKRSYVVPVVVIGVVVVSAILAVVLTRDTGTSKAGTRETRAVAVTGAELPRFPGNGRADPAVGMAAPAVRGASFDGTPVSIANDGTPKVIMFLAHWCPHCRHEVPLVQSWIDTSGMPGGVGLYSVSTSVDPAQANYPPSAWLERERWSVPVIADDDDRTALARFGVSEFPMFVFVNRDGTVAGRTSGELPIATLEQFIRRLVEA